MQDIWTPLTSTGQCMDFNRRCEVCYYRNEYPLCKDKYMSFYPISENDSKDFSYIHKYKVEGVHNG